MTYRVMIVEDEPPSMRDIEKKIAIFYTRDKVYYQDNEVGEIVRNYLQWCK